MKDFNLIAILISIDKRKLIENAFCLKNNKKRYLSRTREIEKNFIISNRKITFAQKQFNDNHCKYDFTHRFQLFFDKTSKNFSKKYSFDINSQNCNVLLRNRNAQNINELHFFITFDDIIDDKKHFILRNSSTNETIVNYNDQAKNEMRRHFIWILNFEKKMRNEKSMSTFANLISKSNCSITKRAKSNMTRK